MATIRQRMIDLLRDETVAARDISKIVGIREKAVYEHLIHIGKSVAAQNQKLAITPSECLACGFAFEDRRRPTRPGRCPRCRSERIREPLFHIE